MEITVGHNLEPIYDKYYEGSDIEIYIKRCDDGVILDIVDYENSFDGEFYINKLDEVVSYLTELLEIPVDYYMIDEGDGDVNEGGYDTSHETCFTSSNYILLSRVPYILKSLDEVRKLEIVRQFAIANELKDSLHRLVVIKRATK